MKPILHKALLAVAGLAVLGVLVPAAADWLVTKDGDRIETDGPWRVEDRLIVFKRADGTYASMRRSEIDLDASEKLTRAKKEAAEAPPPQQEKASERDRPVVARLTEKDLPPVGTPTRAEEAEPGDEEDGAEADEPPESLQVMSWREARAVDSAGLEFVGDVRNVTEHTALGVAIMAVLRDDKGEEIDSQQAELTASSLDPGQTARFRVSFPGVFDFASIEFRSTADMVLNKPPEQPAPSDADAEQQPEGAEG